MVEERWCKMLSSMIVESVLQVPSVQVELNSNHFHFVVQFPEFWGFWTLLIEDFAGTHLIFVFSYNQVKKLFVKMK